MSGERNEQRLTLTDFCQGKSRPIIKSLAPWLREQLGSSARDKARRANSLCIIMLKRIDPLHPRWPDRDRLQHRRTIHQANCAQSQECALLAPTPGPNTGAIIASLIATAKLNGVAPLAYLSDILTKIVNGHANNQLDDLLAWAYAANLKLHDVAREHRLRSS